MIKRRLFGQDFDENGKSLLKGQVFTNKKVEYSYNEFKDSLEVVGEIDLFEQMQSVEYTKLDKILNRFLETGETSILNAPIHKVNAFVQKCEVLNEMSDTISELEQYKRDHNIDIDVSLSDIANQILNAKSSLDSYLKAKLNEKENKNEKENVNEEKQAPVQTNGNENA